MRVIKPMRLFIACSVILCSGFLFGQAAGQSGKETDMGLKPLRETFLDTLNRGREIRLTHENPAPEPVKTVETAPVVKKPTADGFRIQLMALTTMEAARIKKSALEKELKQTVYIDEDAPYYKLFVGNYAARKDAERALNLIKQSGYPDAWIVKTAIVSGE